MPLYDYDCAACGRRIEVVHGVHAPGPTHCPNCGSGPLRKAITAAAVHFKGTGWAKKERRASVAATSGSAPSPDGPSSADADGKDAGTADKAAKATDVAPGGSDSVATAAPKAKPAAAARSD